MGMESEGYATSNTITIVLCEENLLLLTSLEYTPSTSIAGADPL